METMELHRWHLRVDGNDLWLTTPVVVEGENKYGMVNQVSVIHDGEILGVIFSDARSSVHTLYSHANGKAVMLNQPNGLDYVSICEWFLYHSGMKG